ncbi:MAG TPA: cell wall hydrolase [Rhodopila sp.]|jgi:hypothetical protein|nr:cell wall hydrolase [Rhodopila sp.]
MQLGRIYFVLALIIVALPALAKANDINTYNIHTGGIHTGGIHTDSNHTDSNNDPSAAAANVLRRLPPDTIIPGIRWQSAAERDQILCLALAMYHEARGETEAERTAVAQVIFNRALHTNASVCATIWAGHGSQFQWVKASDTLVPRESAAWKADQDSALRFARHRPADTTHGATNFFNPALCSPGWSKAGHVTMLLHQEFLRIDGWDGRFANKASSEDPISQRDQSGRLRPTRSYGGGRS